MKHRHTLPGLVRVSALAAAPALAGALLLVGTGGSPASAASTDGGRGTIGVAQVRNLKDLGRAPAAMPVRIAVVFKYRNAAQLESLIRAQGDPHSPLYHRFLSPAQFREAFALREGDLAGSLRTFHAAGFHVDAVSGNRTVADLSAPAAVAERFFTTELHRVVQPGVGVRYANVRPATIPVRLRGTVANVLGLDNLDARDLMGATSDANDAPAPSLGGSLFGPDGAYAPVAIADAYDLPVQHGYDGTGRSVGIALYADFHEADLATFLSTFGITRTGPATVRIAVDGGAGFSAVSKYTTMDVETVIGLSAGSGLSMYLFPSPAQSYIVDVLNRAVADNTVDVLYAGFALCEASSTGLAQAIDTVAAQGTSQGITVVAGSGDAGAFSCGSFALPADATPADSPHVVAVGGTNLTINNGTGGYVKELGWRNSGGGQSMEFSTPAYQSGLSGPSGTRGVPDVAFDAAPKSGVSVYYQGHWLGHKIGGTSISGAIYSAFQAQVDDERGTRFGLANTYLYAALANHGYTVYHDVTHGCQFSSPSEGSGWCAGPGYDLVTGIGSPRGYSLSLVL